MEKESTYKIISVKKKHPIFICKAIPVINHVEPLPAPSPPLHNNLFFKQELRKVNSKFSSPKLKEIPNPSPRL